jgi:hypothetical protein
MTLDEIRRNQRPHKEDHCSDMGETASATVNQSRDIAAAGVLSARNFNSGCVAEDSGDISDIRFQAKQKICKSNVNLQEYRDVCGDKVTVIFDRKVNSEHNGGTSVQPVRAGHTVIKAPTQIRDKDRSAKDDTSTCSNAKIMSLVSDYLPLKQTEDGLRNVGDGKNFLVSESNRNDEDCFDQTNKIISRTQSKPSPIKRKNTNPRGGPPPKRPRLVPATSDSLQDSEVTPQVNGCTDFSKLNGKPYLDSVESGSFRLGQQVTDISEESFKSCSMRLTNRSSSISFNNSGCGAAQSIDTLSQTTPPLITSELSSKHPDSSLNGLENVIRVTSNSPSSQRLESKLDLATTTEKRALDGKKECEISRSELGDMDIDDELLLLAHDDSDTSLALDTEEDILLQMDEILNDTFL